MLPEQRREAILEYIKIHKNVAGGELARHFRVTEETIRKDLIALNDRGFIMRTFGGAFLRDDYDPPLAQRTIANLKEKEAIARKAAEYIGYGDCVVLDAGSTVIELAKKLRENLELVALTNSLEIINVLSGREGISVISSGGTLMAKSMSFCGSLAEYSLTSYNIQKAFISAIGVSLEEGVMESNERQALFKRKVVELAKEVTVLVDHTKFGKMAHETVCRLDRVRRIVTDGGIDPNVLSLYREAGAEVVIADN